MRRTGERGPSTPSSALAGGGAKCSRVIDADLQHPPEIVLQLWTLIRAGADMAVASRTSTGRFSDWSLPSARIVARRAVLGLAILPGVVGRVSDPISATSCSSGRGVQGGEAEPLGYKILIEILGARGFAGWARRRTVFRERSEGASKVTWKVYVETFAICCRCGWRRCR